MAQVTILRRERVLRPSAAPGAAEVVEVSYSTPVMLPRTVHLPLELYRAATADELAANPRYQVLPADDQGVVTEREKIQADIKVAIAAVPQTFELP
jgi:hypothetical protein